MLIFLDIDGVMVPTKSWKSPQLLNDGFYEFSGKAVKVLQELVSDDSTIMLTTSHKSRFTSEDWKGIFFRRGIAINKLEKLDDHKFRLSRKDEILNWFDFHNVNEDFVIIDDDKSLNDLPLRLKEKLILTSSMIGLADYHLDEINSVLIKKLQAA